MEQASTTQAIPPTLQEIEAAQEKLKDLIRYTPTYEWKGPGKDEMIGEETIVHVKLELLQRAGSFKPRGALINMMALTPEQLTKGVTAVSAGNHAIAVGYAAQVIGTSSKVVMPRSANRFRIQRCQALGAEVVLVDNVTEAFAEAERIQREEGRTFIHPFEGKLTATGTATLGYEFAHQVPDMDAVIIPIGGGGLAAGMATALKLLQPNCKVYGVEPTGADTMYRSLQSGHTESIDVVRTIADSLGAPFSMPYSMAICQKYLKKVVLVEDHQLRSAMRHMFVEMKLAAEPAGAASLAALLGPLKEELKGKKVGLIACGSNIDVETYFRYLGGQ
ncbi:MAG: threonine/serine dehydratase [Bacteroidota bacterium]